LIQILSEGLWAHIACFNPKHPAGIDFIVIEGEKVHPEALIGFFLIFHAINSQLLDIRQFSRPGFTRNNPAGLEMCVKSDHFIIEIFELSAWTLRLPYIRYCGA